jgi:hypothetical protein
MCSNISPQAPAETSQSQITIGIGISLNTERAEATVGLAISAPSDLTMRCREARSSSLAPTYRTILQAASTPGGCLRPSHPRFAIGSLPRFLLLESQAPHDAGTTGKSAAARLLIDGFLRRRRDSAQRSAGKAQSALRRGQGDPFH